MLPQPLGEIRERALVEAENHELPVRLVGIDVPDDLEQLVELAVDRLDDLVRIPELLGPVRGLAPGLHLAQGRGRGIEVEALDAVLAGDDEVALASMLCRLTTNEALRIQLADSASDRIARHHTRDALATATSSVYERVLSRPSGVPAGERAPAGVSNGRDTR